jgi:hypothetical protein
MQLHSIYFSYFYLQLFFIKDGQPHRSTPQMQFHQIYFSYFYLQLFIITFFIAFIIFQYLLFSFQFPFLLLLFLPLPLLLIIIIIIMLFFYKTFNLFFFLRYGIPTLHFLRHEEFDITSSP